MANELPAFTSVGSYPILYLDREENCLCAACASKEWEESGHKPRGDVYWEGEPIDCDECGEEIASAYGPVEP